MHQSTFESLYALLNQKAPTYSAQWRKSKEEFGHDWENQISLNIARVFGQSYNEDWNEAVRGYIEFCTDALRAQVFFERHGHYKAANYDECLEKCYRNQNYMKIKYLPGQYLSHYIWPHHYRMLRHYVDCLLPKIADEIHRFCEVGVGCGMYSQKTLEVIDGCHGVGVDISDYALEFTLKVIAAHNLRHRYEVVRQDILKEELRNEADLIISQEVLEHLEDPQAFLFALHKATRAGGWGYITAAVNAAHTDHIYLYRSPDDVRVQIEKAGWRIVDIQTEENYPQKPREIRPTIAGFLARKD